MASLLENCYEAKIQVDERFVMGRQGEKGCLLWYLSIILNPAFLDLEV